MFATMSLMFVTQSLIFATRSLMFVTRSLMFATQSLIFATMSLMFATRSLMFATQSLMFVTQSLIFATMSLKYTTRSFFLFFSKTREHVLPQKLGFTRLHFPLDGTFRLASGSFGLTDNHDDEVSFYTSSVRICLRLSGSAPATCFCEFFGGLYSFFYS